MKTDAMCRHPRIARTIGWPYYGSFTASLRARATPGDACDAYAREETETSHLTTDGDSQVSQAPLAIEATPPDKPTLEPELVAPPVSEDAAEPQSAHEPHIRWRDRKTIAGPPSLRQRLEQERARRGGDGKRPW